MTHRLSNHAMDTNGPPTEAQAAARDGRPARDTDLVTVYIPTRNRLRLLQRAIASVLAQSHPHIEIIVIDDGSTDGTASFLEQLSRKDGRVRHRANPVPKGAPAARNQAIALARGRFITGLDDDDEFTPDRIAHFLENHDDRFSFLSSCVIERGRNYCMAVHQPSQTIDSQRIRRKNYVGNQIFVRTDRVRAVGGFDEDLRAWQDYDLWLRLIDAYGPALKLSRCTYILDRSDKVDRITTSDSAHIGHQQFLAKHRDSMTPLQIRHQIINDLHNRSVRIGLLDYLRLLRRDTAVRLNALVFKAYWPWAYRLLVRTHMRLTQGTRRHRVH